MFKTIGLKLVAIFMIAMFVSPMLSVIHLSTSSVRAAGLIIPTSGYTAECAVEPYTTTAGIASGYGPNKAIDGIVSDASRFAYSSVGSAIPAGTMTTTKYVTYDLGVVKTFNTLSFWMDRQIASTGANFKSLSMQYDNALDDAITLMPPLEMTFTTASTNDIVDGSQTIKKYTTSRLATITARYVRFAFTYTKNCAINVVNDSIPTPVEINLSYDFDTIIPITAYTAACAVEPYTNITNLSSTLTPSKAIDGDFSYASRWAYGGTAWTSGQVGTRYVTYDLGAVKTFNEMTFYRLSTQTNFTFNNCSIQVSDTLDSTLVSSSPLTLTFNVNEGDKYNNGAWIYKHTTTKFVNQSGRYVRLGFTYTSTTAETKSPAMPIEIILGLNDDVLLAQNSLEIGLGSNADLNTVATDLTLPTSLFGTEISWASDNAVITSEGVVTPNNQAQTVTLTATIVKDGCNTVTKPFTVTVINNVQAAFNDLSSDTIKNLNPDLDHVTTDLSLPTSLLGATIEWASDNAAIAADGIVTKPTEGKQTVTLTSTIKNSDSVSLVKTFSVTVWHEIIIITQTINNDLISVLYNEGTGKFTVSDLVSQGATFLKEGQFVDVNGTSSVEATAHPVFGAGQSIKINYPNGNIDYISVYPNVPFVFIKSVKANLSDAPIILNRINTVYANVDLGVDYNKLKVTGTGGLNTPDLNPGSYMYLATVDPTTRRGVVSGWLDQDRGSGVVFSSKADNLAKISPRIDYGNLKINANSSETTQTFVIGYFDDARVGLENYADLIAKYYNIKLKSQLSGYCTYYSEKYGGAGDETHVAQIGNYGVQNLKPYGFGYVQIDGAWWVDEATGINTTRYPSGMNAVVNKLNANGLIAGAWTMSFGRNYDAVDTYFADKQNYFIKKQDGTPYTTTWGGTCLDMTNPDTINYMKGFINRLVNTWGFKFIKADGLYTGMGVKMNYINTYYKEDNLGESVLYNKDKTNIDAFRDGLKLYRQTAGDDVFILGCNIQQNMRTFGASIGLVDAMRIGPDNSASWDKLTRGPTYGSRFYFLNNRVWYNDPDPVYVRNSMAINQSRYIATWVGLTGSLYANSDWLPDLGAERLNLLKRTMPIANMKPQPVDYFDKAIPNMWVLNDDQKASNQSIIGLFNSSTTSSTITETFDRIGLAKNTTYEAYDFWNNQLLPQISGSVSFDVPAQDTRVIAVRPVSSYPQVISTSRHITQGMFDIKSETWNRSNSSLDGVSQVIGSDPYELRIVARTGKISDVVISDADKSAGATISYVQSGDLIRVTINSPTGRDIAWSVKFNSVFPYQIKNIVCSQQTSDTFNVTTDILNNSIAQQNVLVFVAVYKKADGKLISVKNVSTPIVGNYHLNETMNGILNDCTVKVFVWENTSLKPLSLISQY